MRSEEKEDLNAWWSELNHGGMLLSPAVLREYLPEGPPPINPDAYNKLRDAYMAFEIWSDTDQTTTENTALYRWLDDVFEKFLGFPAELWQKETSVHTNFKFSTPIGEQLRPNRVLLRKGETLSPSFFIKIDTRKGQLGMGKGRVNFSKFLTLLRGANTHLGIFTNGLQFRLVFVGMDYDCWAEWDVSRWFEDERGLKQLEGFTALCGTYGMFETDEDDFPLLNAVRRSRTRQGELSSVLGEHVRLAVEQLLSDFDSTVRTHPSLLEPLRTDPVASYQLKNEEVLNALYHAAVRVIMRLVVVLFAEARELLPRNIEKYHTSYGIEGLFVLLENAKNNEGEINLRESDSAWPRILSLFRLIHEGGCNHDIPVLRYGGELFKRGDPTSPDPVLRALAIFEDDRWKLNDYRVLEILRLLKIGKVRARKGRTSTWVSGPVDFSDLRTEYIGMMYEGLLDYQLKQVTEDQNAVIFLNLGQQPALPLNLLESLSDGELRDLIKKLRKEKSGTPMSTENEGDESNEEKDEIDEIDEEDIEESEELEESEEELEAEESQSEEENEVSARVYRWAERAIEIGKLVKKPVSKEVDLYAYEEEKRKKISGLLGRKYFAGQMYLVRWSGTRKGTGTFYTRPQLAVPTVHRTLESLIYDKNEETGELIPQEPEKILSLKVVDPAMGSASFLVAALRYLTDAVYESLLYYKKIREKSSEESIITLPFGLESRGGIQEELLPVPPGDERFEEMLKARLKRHVVERCIYGVDIDPLAVELAQLSLWVETMDRELPFEFLKHKLKVGDSLVGCWLNQFEDYPILAWEREGGDGSKDIITKKIKKIKNEHVKPQMRKWIERMGPQKILTAWLEEESAVSIQEKNIDLFSKIHDLKIEEKEQFFITNLQDNEKLNLLKKAMDRWCAIWFWPVDVESVEALTPDRFYEPKKEDEEVIEDIAKKIRFFHWELEFPDVFTKEDSGFDVILGNPPWEIMKPNSKEFFTRYDPIYRTYGRQEALEHQEEFFEKYPQIKTDWISYRAFYKSMSNWVKNVQDPFDSPLARGKLKEQLKKRWKEVRQKRLGFVSKDVPYRYQGSADLNTYKMFLEASHHLLKNGGRLGMIIPSGLYTDEGSTDLRSLFINFCKWEWLFSFENRKKIFNIHSSAKFGPVIIEKGGKTDAIKTVFMIRDLSEWESLHIDALLYKKEQIDLFSPKSHTILEIRSYRDSEITEKIHHNSALLEEKFMNELSINYSREFDMTNDSKSFSTIDKWLSEGYKKDDYGKWVNPDNDNICLPLYEGRMIGQFNFFKKGWVSGKGRSAIWRNIPFEDKQIEPQYLMSLKTFIISKKSISKIKLAYMHIGSSTNKRSMYSSVIMPWPTNHSLGILFHEKKNQNLLLGISAIFNSFIFDYQLRLKLGGLNISWFLLKEMPYPLLFSENKDVFNYVNLLSAKLTFIFKGFSDKWLLLRQNKPEIFNKLWKSLWAITNHERLRLRCILDAIIAELYGLDYEDLAWILQDCDYPVEKLNDRSFTSTLDPKGFWRVDKDKPPELRHTTLTLLAFKKLKEIGLEAFCQEDWQFPEDIQEKLGPRFLPWQLEGTPEESWAECEQHAKNMSGEEEFKKFMDKLNKQDIKEEKPPEPFKLNKFDEPLKQKDNQTSLSSWGVEK